MGTHWATMAMHNIDEHTHNALHVVLCYCQKGSYSGNRVNISDSNINAGNSLIFNFPNINRKIKKKPRAISTF